jgi:hypothetical protein
MTVATITTKTEINFHETFFNDLFPYLSLAIRFKVRCRGVARGVIVMPLLPFVPAWSDSPAEPSVVCCHHTKAPEN